MKCPQCGQWNKASLPRCFHCGAPLIATGEEHTWQEDLHIGKPKQYTSVNDEGKVETAIDKRDALADEMDHLKHRIERGTEVREKLRALSEQKQDWHPGENVYSDYQPEDERYGQKKESFVYRDTPRVKARKRKVKLILRIVIIALILVALAFGVVMCIKAYQEKQAALKAANQPIIFSSMMDDLAAHTIMIPGEEGATIYIRELYSSYIVTGGYATVQVADHTWYDNYVDYLDEKLTVNLTPYLKTSSGQQKPLDVISFDVDIPLSPLEMLYPDTEMEECATTLYTIQFVVRPGSEVTVNGTNYSDLVNAKTGKVSINQTIQPIGNNDFTITVRSQYCREQVYNFTIYRAEQSIPLDLATDTDDDSTTNYMKIKATTLPGATVEVVTPYSDLDISSTAVDGSFTFYALFDHYGDNTVTISTSYPGRETTYLSYKVSYVPDIDKYSRAAWEMTAARGYTEYLDNPVRAQNQQIYVVKGTIQEIISNKPQVAQINVGTETSPLLVTLTNDTQTTWAEGTWYRIYADGSSSYNGTPWLVARYTYTTK